MGQSYFFTCRSALLVPPASLHCPAASSTGFSIRFHMQVIACNFLFTPFHFNNLRPTRGLRVTAWEAKILSSFSDSVSAFHFLSGIPHTTRLSNPENFLKPKTLHNCVFFSLLRFRASTILSLTNSYCESSCCCTLAHPSTRLQVYFLLLWDTNQINNIHNTVFNPV